MCSSFYKDWLYTQDIRLNLLLAVVAVVFHYHNGTFLNEYITCEIENKNDVFSPYSLLCAFWLSAR